MIQNKYLIATSKAPTEETVEAFVEAVKAAATEEGCTLVAMRGQPGPGCYNIAVIVKSDSKDANETFARVLTGALGPVSRYCDCADPDWTGCSDWVF